MLAASAQRILERLSDQDVVLDVGAWASPFPRADWVLDLMPYETRGLYGESDRDAERFGPGTWIQRDICDREPFPFEDDQVDFAICSHTLEDLRDPVWVCGELNRVAKAGYIEVPSRLEEQSWGVHGPWVGWSHHRWLVDLSDGRVEFVAKPHHVGSSDSYHFPARLGATLTDEERVQTLFWRGEFTYRERVFMEPSELDAYLAGFVTEHTRELARRVGRRSPLRHLRRRRPG